MNNACIVVRYEGSLALKLLCRIIHSVYLMRKPYFLFLFLFLLTDLGLLPGQTFV